MKNRDNKLIKLLQGGSKKMEKLLTVLGCLGVTLVVVGTLTACQANKEAEIQSAASQVEISTESSVPAPTNEEALQKEIEAMAQKVADSSVNNTQEKIKKAEQQFISEAQVFWNAKQEELSTCIKNGLKYEEFEKTYLYFRAGVNDLGIVDANYACELTIIEMQRLYGTDVQDYSALDKSNITLNPDGTYTYTEEYIGAISSYSYFDGASSEEINKFLQDWGYLFIDLAGAEANDVMSLFEGGNLHKENETIRQSEGKAESSQNNSSSGQSQSSQNQSNSNSGNNNSSQSNNQSSQSNSQPVDEVITDPNYEIKPDPSIWGDVDTAPIGGGGQGEIPDGFTGIH